MILELSQWASGISLPWALFSLAIGGLILLTIAVRLWLEYGDDDGDDEQ